MRFVVDRSMFVTVIVHTIFTASEIVF